MHEQIRHQPPHASPDAAPSGKVTPSGDRSLSRLPAFHDAVYGSKGVGHVLAVQAAAVAIWLFALTARFVFNPYLPPGFPYLTFFPAVIITGFVFGMYPALTCAILCGASAWFWFIPPFDSFKVDSQTLTALIFFLIVVGIDLGLLRLALSAYAAQARAHRDLAKALALQEVVSLEVDHRIKNLLATVSGLISLSQKHADTPAELAQQLRQRIGAMGNAVVMLRNSLHGAEADMQTAIAAAVGPLGISVGTSPGCRMQVNGPKVVLNSAALMAINLILHELCTNAVKYGAMSNESGAIMLNWQVATGEDGDEMVQLEWRETGGPVVAKPERTGFGTELARRMSATLGGSSDFEFKAEGLVVRMTIRSATASA